MTQFSVEETSPAYWRVTFANGPVNLLDPDPDTVDELAALVDRAEQRPQLRVVVFRSDNPDFFMAHWDFRSDGARVAAMRPGPTGLHPYVDNFIFATAGRPESAGVAQALFTAGLQQPDGVELDLGNRIGQLR